VPVVLLSANPAGKGPETIAQLNGAMPPEAVHVAEYGRPT
jgi:hypothetical protein